MYDKFKEFSEKKNFKFITLRTFQEISHISQATVKIIFKNYD